MLKNVEERQSGFTLLVLVVSIVIIMILVVVMGKRTGFDGSAKSSANRPVSAPKRVIDKANEVVGRSNRRTADIQKQIDEASR